MNGNTIKIIVKDDPRLKDLMLNVDENYVYYYNELDKKIYRVSYDGKTKDEIYSGTVDAFQIYDNKLYVKGREKTGKKNILYIYDLNYYSSKSDSSDENSSYAKIGSIDNINEFNVSDLGIFFVRAPYGNAFLYRCDLKGNSEQWADTRAVFDWSIYAINGKVYQYDLSGEGQDKGLPVGNINKMNHKTDNAPYGSYKINERGIGNN